MKKLSLLFIYGIFFVTTVSAQITSWEIGSPVAANVTATLSGGTLIISGNGAMMDYMSASAPWYGERELITNVTIGFGVTNIGNGAFMNCRSLASVVISNSVESIGFGAFVGCKILPSITIPSSVTFIDKEAFLGCEELPSISVDAANIAYISIDGVLFNKDKTTLVACPNGKTGIYVVPESVKTIWASAFNYCQNLTHITINEGVTSIGVNAFNDCISLTSITFPKTLKTIDDFAFAHCSSLSSVTFPLLLEKIGIYAFYNCVNLLEVINLNPTPLSIHNSVFDSVDLSVCILRVPAVSVEAYQQDARWMQFHNIEPIESETALELDKVEIYLIAGATTVITATVTGSATVIWNSNHPVVAEVSNTGTVTGISQGTTVITASSDLEVAMCTVTVIQPGKTAIAGNIANAGTENTRVNLYLKVDEP